MNPIRTEMEAGTTEEAVAVVQARNTGSLVLVVLEKVVRVVGLWI